MTPVDLVDAIAHALETLWPGRTIYREFCPDVVQRPSVLLYAADSSAAPGGYGLLNWEATIKARLYGSSETYDQSAVEELRQDEKAVLERFVRPIPVGDRRLTVLPQVKAPRNGYARMTFAASWSDSGGETAANPPAEHYKLSVNA